MTKLDLSFAARTASDLQSAMGTGCYASAYAVDEIPYIVTSGTGEGREFAYDADDVQQYLDKIESGAERFDYTKFCEDCQPLFEVELAKALATHCVRIARGGSCSWILSDADYQTCVDSDEYEGEAL